MPSVDDDPWSLAALGLARDPIGNPLGYPGRLPEESGLLDGDRFLPLRPDASAGGGWRLTGGEPLDDALRRRGRPALADRHPVLAVGSNGSPAQMRRKLNGRARVLVPMTYATARGIVSGRVRPREPAGVRSRRARADAGGHGAFRGAVARGGAVAGRGRDRAELPAGPAAARGHAGRPADRGVRGAARLPGRPERQAFRADGPGRADRRAARRPAGARARDGRGRPGGVRRPCFATTRPCASAYARCGGARAGSSNRPDSAPTVPPNRWRTPERGPPYSESPGEAILFPAAGHTMAPWRRRRSR